ncbi:hypothetical protein WJX81_000964 [Elliptochloris bilobata]|uniref:peptidylprolyl isomerase n=1 Tax=Elliptochloris bilobata TaxID=381761 RepID=A0AAW1R1B4_9CHLO
MATLSGWQRAALPSARKCPLGCSLRGTRGVQKRWPAPAGCSKGKSREPAQLSELPAERPAEGDPPPPTLQPQQARSRQKAASTDWISSALTRRFGLAGGLLWFSFLTFGVVSEQVKTRLEVGAEKQSEQAVNSEEVRTEHGVFRDLTIGGGRTPERGLLVLLDYRLTAGNRVLEDTKAKGRPVLFTFGSRPPKICLGAEEALASMRAGGRREVVIPPGSGQDCNSLNGEAEALVYDISLLRVSVPPS